MSSVMDRLKKENSSSAVFVLTDEEKASLSGETPTHTLSYAIRDGAKRNEVDGLVLNKTRSELHDAACTVGALRIVGSRDICMEIKIDEKQVGSVAADLF